MNNCIVNDTVKEPHRVHSPAGKSSCADGGRPGRDPHRQAESPDVPLLKSLSDGGLAATDREGGRTSSPFW
ncbi:hypothetical protein [Enterobacter roggenkampii]|uniref:hypothetical protein n=1 Tax=Enterobacter roggenkampii TaxID=1812935 RepID=UPI001FD7DB44|nr:hypothetical protein [Enterobacter roggenkampii]